MMAAFIIRTLLANSLVWVPIEVEVIIPKILPQIILPLAVELAVMAALCATLFHKIKKENDDDEMPEAPNLAQLKSALVFGLLYGFILSAVVFTKK